MLGFARIPDVSTGSDAKGNFTVYNIHLNGFYHCSLRYSQLLDLHNELKPNFDTTQLEGFPPKYWRSSLSEAQQAERRVLLERYIQSVCQNRVMGPSEMVKEFWLGAQRAGTDLSVISGDLDVYLVNGKKVTLQVQLSDRTDQVLEQVCKHIEMDSELCYYFGLYMEREDADSTVLVCPLTDYQSPLITLHTANRGDQVYRVTIRQHFWDPTFVPTLLEDRVAKNMLYIEAVHSIALGYIDVPRDTKDQLTTMKSKGQKKEYLDTVSSLPQFGYRQFEGFSFNHPMEGMEGCVRVGRSEVVTYTHHGRGVWAQCQRYPLTRIRSWKVGFNSQDGTPWLHMSCQVSKDEFVWVHLSGEHAVFLNLSLHSTVNELLRIRGGQPIRSPSSQPIYRVLREFPRVVITHAPSNGSLNGSLSEGRSSPDIRSRLTSTSSDAGNGSVTSDDTSGGGVVSDEASGGGVALPRGDRAPVSKPKKTQKKAAAKVSLTDTENPTFNFGTDDDL